MEQTRAGIDRLRADVAVWAKARAAKDSTRQYHTQLASIQRTFGRAMDRIRTLSEDLAGQPDGDAFEGCRAVDRQVSLVRRLWRWYADKFDQRDDPRYTRVLLAADEVVWAVHAEVYRRAGFEQLPPAPLPYLDAVEAPEAVLRDEPPAQLAPDSFDDHLKALLSRLPVPVVALPEAARAQPWTLVLLGHEVGHHLQYDLRPRFGLVASTGQEVARAGGPNGRWRSWGRELFADLAGLVTMGAPALAALLPYELGSDQWMVADERDSYPPPAVRIALLLAVAERLGLNWREQLAGWNPSSWEPAGLVAARDGDPYPAERAAARADLTRVPAVADVLVKAPVVGASTLAELAGFDAAEFGPGGRVPARVPHLLSDGGPAEQGLVTVRELASAGMLAWQRIWLASGPGAAGGGGVAGGAGEGEPVRAAARLAATLIDRLIDSREPGPRAAEVGVPPAADEDLVAALAGEARP